MIEALRFTDASTEALKTLDEAGWRKALAFCDRTQLTLPLGLRRREDLPKWVRSRLDSNFADNAERWRRTRDVYGEAAKAFDAAGLEFLVLKGFSQCPDFVPQPWFRAQYDMDLLFPREQAWQAGDVALELGYTPIGDTRELPVDHLPTMVRRTGWRWRGEYFDPDLPLALELHFRLWDEDTERIEVGGLNEFWDRRVRRQVDGLHFTAFSSADSFAYACLHLFRHLLRGDVKPSNLYELAWFLEHHRCEAAFELHDRSLRRIEAVCGALAETWFGCRLPGAMAEEIGRLEEPVRRWLENYAHSPLAGLFHPNKDELWLHLSLLTSGRAKAAILRRRLMPISMPGPLDAVHLPESERTWRVRLRSKCKLGWFIAQRFAHHARSLPGAFLGGIQWASSSAGFSAQYWRFFAAAGFFDFGLFIFYLLYNLYLLELGFGERFLGFVSSAMLAGSIAGSIPAAYAIQRFGIRNTLTAGFVVVGGVSALRASVAFAPALLALAFLAGLASSVWPVSISPAVAQLTSERNRSLGFSMVFSSGIAIGIFGGLIGGRLPGWLARLNGSPLTWMQYREALIASCAIALMAAWPSAGLKFRGEVTGAAGLRRPSPRLVRFLIAGAVWNLGTGAFNPFFSAFFARLKVPVEMIGGIFSAAQLAQVGAILSAPLVLRRLGLIRGISSMQLLTAGALLCLAVAGGPLTASAGYGIYMVFQYMSEPGLYTMLMDSVPETERGSASGLNFLVAASAQAIAAGLAGAMVERMGYPAVLMIAACLCAIAGVLFRTLLGGSYRSSAAGKA